jgi:hypothetical protein
MTRYYGSESADSANLNPVSGNSLRQAVPAALFDREIVGLRVYRDIHRLHRLFHTGKYGQEVYLKLK